MDETPNTRFAGNVPTAELLSELLKQSAALVKTEIALAKTELTADVKREARAATGLGIAGLCTIGALQLVLAAAVLGFSEVMPAWGAALVVAAILFTIAVVTGVLGWTKRVKQPLPRTQQTLKEDVQWKKTRTN